MKVKLSELVHAFMMTDGFANETFICRRTSEIHYRSDYVDPDDPPPDDLDDETKYVAIPCQADLHLGKSLAIDFTPDHLPDDLDDVYDIFRRKGAFGRFKLLLERKGALEQWHAYQEKEQELALRDWCEELGIEIEDG